MRPGRNKQSRAALGASPAVQCLRIHLTRQGPICSLVWEIPHATEQLSLGATTTEAREPSSLRSKTRDAITARSRRTVGREQPPPPATRQSPRAATKTQRSQKIVFN